MNSDNIKKMLFCIHMLLLTYGCSQPTKPAHMKWIAKYDFFDFYKNKIEIKQDDFRPTDDARFSTFKFLDENTIFLAGSIPKRDSIIGQNDFGFIFISKDKGKNYNQILFPEENVTFIGLSNKYSLIETNSNGYSP